MNDFRFIPQSGGAAFLDGEDRGRVLVFGRQTGGTYGLIEFSIAVRPPRGPEDPVEFGPHLHAAFEETFFVRLGKLRFLLEEEVLELEPGDFVRVPPGTRHGFANLSDAPVNLLISFVPGGFEELFVRHSSDQALPPRPNGFMDDAISEFASTFES